MSRSTTTYHLEQGIAHPYEHRAVFRHGTEDGAYLTMRGTYQGGEEVTRIITRSKRKDGYTVTQALAFRNPLHARAGLGLITQGGRR